MDYFLLPERIKSQLPELAGASPSVFNSAGGLDGSSGECYLVAGGDAIRLFFKTFGADGYEQLDAPFSDPSFSMRTRREKFNAILEISSSSWSHFLKFSSFDANKVEELAASCMAGRQAAGKNDGEVEAATAPEETKNGSAPAAIDPFAGFLAALMFVSKADDSIEEGEDKFIREAAGGDMALLGEALKLHSSLSAKELAVALSSVLDHDGRLCVVANMLELAVSDGLLRSSEQKLVDSFATAMGVSQDEYTTIRDVLVLKTSRSLLKTSAK